MAICNDTNRDPSGQELEQLFNNHDRVNSSQTSRQQNGSPCFPFLATSPSSGSHFRGSGPTNQNGHQGDNRASKHYEGRTRSRYDSDNSSSSGGFSSSSGLPRRRVRRPPPDGGWGWMVVLASFAVNLISDGVSLSFGIFLPDLTAYFAVGRGHAAWVASLFLSMPLLAGPIASWLTDRFGCRRVCIVGSLLATLGFVLSFFCNSLALLYITFSLAGFGLALCYVTSIVIVAYYFEKKRCLATGLSVCGTGVGTFIFAPLTYVLVGEFMWRGTLLILAGFFLNMVVSGALMRDLDDGDDEDENTAPRSPSPSHWDSAGNLEEGKRMCSSLLQLPTYLSNESPRLPVQVLTEMSSNEKGHLSTLLEKYPNLWNDVLKNNSTDPYLTVKSSPLIKTIIEDSTHDEQPETKVISLNSTRPPLNLTEPEKSIKFVDWCPLPPTTEVPELDAANHEHLRQSVEKLSSLEVLHKKSDDEKVFNDQRRESSKGECNGKDDMIGPEGMRLLNDRCRNSLKAEDSNALLVRNSFACITSNSARKSSSLRQPRQASFGPLALPRERANSAAYLRNLRLQRGSLTYRGAMLNIKRYRLKASSCPNIYRNSMATINENDYSPCEFFEDLKEVVCDMMDVRLLTNFKYALFCLSNFLLNACVDNPYVYIPDHAASLPSIQEGSGAFIISIVGVLNTLGVVIVGYVGDKPWIDPSLLYALCTIVAGISVAAIPLLSSYLPLATASAIYGFTISANYTLVPEIVVNLISLDNFTGAYGLLLLIQGIAGLIGPPIAGWLYDISGSYDTTFYISGLSILASGILVIPVAQSWKCTCRPRSEDDESDTSGSHEDLDKKAKGLERTDEMSPSPVQVNGLSPDGSILAKSNGNSFRSPVSPTRANQVRFAEDLANVQDLPAAEPV